jgi:hypothetical protein
MKNFAKMFTGAKQIRLRRGPTIKWKTGTTPVWTWLAKHNTNMSDAEHAARTQNQSHFIMKQMGTAQQQDSTKK